MCKTLALKQILRENSVHHGSRPLILVESHFLFVSHQRLPPPVVELISDPNRVPMTNLRLNGLIEEIGSNVSSKSGNALGHWQFEYGGRQLVIVTDETPFDRMRIMTPILVESELELSDFRVLLSANYDRAIDAKYALASGYLWSLFTHPLRALSSKQFLDAVEQVKTLADNYGDSYSSSDFRYDA